MDVLRPQLFLCHSHQDVEFVERLALTLMQEKVNVWLDRWELNVGDSLLERIQAAIDRTSYLGIVLSPASVESQWVSRELEAALTRELEESRVVVLPILLRSCEIPLFLRGKVYADFREDFDEGFKALCAALKPLELPTSGRAEQGPYLNDYSIDWSITEDQAGFCIDIASHDNENPVTVLVKLEASVNDIRTQRLAQIEAAGFEWAVPGMLLSHILALQDQDYRVLLEDDQWIEKEESLTDSRTGAETFIKLRVRRLGSLPDRDIVFFIGSILGKIVRNYVEEEGATIPPLEREELLTWLRDNPH